MRNGDKSDSEYNTPKSDDQQKNPFLIKKTPLTTYEVIVK